jgi:FkbM family methyltransferase
MHSIAEQTIHRVWLGGRPIPERYERWWAAWQRQYPERTFRTWRDADVANLRSAPAIQRAQGAARKADIARYDILATHGGTYLDSDIQPISRASWAPDRSGLTVCNEIDGDAYMSIGFIAADKGHPALERAVAMACSRPLNQRPANEETGPFLWREAIGAEPHRRLPKEAFYPYLFNEPYSSLMLRDISACIGVHVWGGSWLESDNRAAKGLDRLVRGDVPEALEWFGDEDTPRLAALRELATRIRHARSAQLDVVCDPVFKLAIPDTARPAFEFVKAAFFLAERASDALIWQIGAADGVLVDPLRAVLVNFDPDAVLVEPNPHMFSRLERNYARNDHAKLVPAAFGRERGRMWLNAVVPERASESGLPDWVMGISSAYADRNALGGLTIDEETTQRIQACVERLEVDCIDAEFLLGIHAGRQPDILVVDVEGMDRDVVDAVLDAGCRPRLILFEVQCMSQGDQAALLGRLGKEYVLVGFGNDVVAYRNDFFVLYTQTLYLDFGLPTVFDAPLRLINGLR